MKKVVMLIALFVGFAGFSQEDSAFKADALKLVKLKSESQFEMMLEPVKNRIPAAKQEAFMKEVRATFPDLYNQIAEIYMETYTHEEIKKVLDFYASPIGKKIIARTPELTKKSMTVGQTWGAKLRPIMMKYMQ